jgi:hypothetical protein
VSSASPRILLLTPPLTQLNTAVPGHGLHQGLSGRARLRRNAGRLGLQLVLRLFSVDGLQQVFA